MGRMRRHFEHDSQQKAGAREGKAKTTAVKMSPMSPYSCWLNEIGIPKDQKPAPSASYRGRTELALVLAIDTQVAIGLCSVFSA